MEKKMTSIGGQALIEGVMMRGPKKIAMAVRKPDGEIIIEEKEVKGIGKWAKVPIVRGVVSFFSSMVIGIQALMFSAKFFDVEDEKTDKKAEELEMTSLIHFKKFIHQPFEDKVSVLYAGVQPKPPIEKVNFCRFSLYYFCDLAKATCLRLSIQKSNNMNLYKLANIILI